MEKPGGRRPTENSSLLGACLKDHAALVLVFIQPSNAHPSLFSSSESYFLVCLVSNLFTNHKLLHLSLNIAGVGGALGDAAPAVVTVDLPSTKPLYVPV